MRERVHMGERVKSTDEAILEARIERRMAIADEMISILESVMRAGEAAGFDHTSGEFRNEQA